MKIGNLTPHEVKLKIGNEIVEIEPSGYVLRVKEVVSNTYEEKRMV